MITVCNKCGTLTDSSSIVKIYNVFGNITTVDICPDCEAKLLKWIKGTAEFLDETNKWLKLNNSIQELTEEIKTIKDIVKPVIGEYTLQKELDNFRHELAIKVKQEQEAKDMLIERLGE